MRTAFVIAQAGTFVGLGVLLFAEGNWRLGLSQFLLAGVNGVIYS